MYIRGQALRPMLVRVIRKHRTGILQQRRDVGSLPSWRRRHVKHALLRLRREGDDGEEGRRGLEHVVPGEVLGRRADGHTALEDLQADVGPLADGFKGHAAVDEGLCKVTPACTQSVGADGHWPRDFVCFEEFDCLKERSE